MSLRREREREKERERVLIDYLARKPRCLVRERERENERPREPKCVREKDN